MAAANRNAAQRFTFPLVVALILVASALRVAGMYDDFWLDEIWSWRVLGYLGSPWQILTHPAARYDNNHPLNTLLMWVQGPHPGWRLYRAPALACGVAGVVAAAVILRRRGAVEAVVATVLVGFSYPLVFFSSEARGYALVVLLALAAFDALERYVDSRGARRWVWNAVYVAACVLGFLSHLTFVYFFAAAVAWSAMRLLRERRKIRPSAPIDDPARHAPVLDYAPAAPRRTFILWHVVRLHGLPALSLALLYVIFVRHLTIGGAPAQLLFDAFRNALGDLLGAQEMPNAAIVLVAVAIILFVATIVLLIKRRDDFWVFLIALVATPAVVVTVQVLFVDRHQPIMARYFLVPYVFFLMGLAILLSAWLKRRDARRVLAAAIVVGFLLLNLYHTVLFLRVGRGHYQDAVLYMVERTNGPVITVLSDHPLRTGLVLEFYKFFVPPVQQLVIYDGTAQRPQWTHGPPMWVIVHKNRRGEPPDQFQGYVFEREFPYYGLSGYSWYLYRRRGF